tara:strand:+ start:2310 stop:2456 length:147 start_codon:yes stop_codon:yes gene_type:complete
LKILIVGATGATGKLLVDQLLENGHEVKAFARTIGPLLANLELVCTYE